MPPPITPGHCHMRLAHDHHHDIGKTNSMQPCAPLLIDLSAMHLLHRASQVADETFARSVSIHHGLTPRQLAVLAVVAEREGMNQTEIVRKSGIDRSTLADVVRRLLRKELIERRPMRHDARAYAISLSESGRAVLAAAAPAATAVDEKILGHLSEEGRQRFLDALAVLADRVEIRLEARPSQIIP